MLGIKYLMLKQKVKEFIEEEDGIGTVEMILILVDNSLPSITYV